MKRWLFFFAMIALGAAGGLYYGWVINPVRYVDTTPDTLREDYKTDYVLMVAEAYHADHDLGLAVRRLALLGDIRPADRLAQATLFAVENGYSQADLALMQQLADDLQAWNPALGAPNP